MFTMDDLLEIAVKMEQNGAVLYREWESRFKNPGLKSMLSRMAGEEDEHGRFFRQMKESLPLSEQERDLKKMVPDTLSDMMKTGTLSMEETDLSAITTISQLFETFIGFEKETIAFYQVLELFIDDPGVLEGLEKIIAQEETHIASLKEKAGRWTEQSLQE